MALDKATEWKEDLEEAAVRNEAIIHDADVKIDQLKELDEKAKQLEEND